MKTNISILFFKKYKNSHILKFLISHNWNKPVSLLFFKLLYFGLFKIMNRIEFLDQNLSVVGKKYIHKEPILIVQNHCGTRDVSLSMAVWAHFGLFCPALVTRESFEISRPYITMTNYFFEMIPLFGYGNNIIIHIVQRLINNQSIIIFPEGSFPSGKYMNSGLVCEGYSGAARIAFEYWKKTGKKLRIQPTCTLGANVAYPPYPDKLKPIFNGKIFYKFGESFTLDFKDGTKDEIDSKTNEIMMKIAAIWNQKHLLPNFNKQYRSQRYSRVGNSRKYD